MTLYEVGHARLGNTADLLLRQALERGHARGYLTAAQRDELAERLEKRVARRSRLDEMTRQAHEDGLYDVDADAYLTALAEIRQGRAGSESR